MHNACKQESQCNIYMYMQVCTFAGMRGVTVHEFIYVHNIGTLYRGTTQTFVHCTSCLHKIICNNSGRREI